MIIKDKEYGEFDVYLGDDGTLDTVVEVWCKDRPLKEIRFSQEYATDFRDSGGTISDNSFAELAEEAVEAYIEQYLIR